jgi:ribonuclease P protein component
MLNPVTRNTFRKPEKICSQNQIDNLFKDGKSVKSGLFRLLYIETELTGKTPIQVLIAVPKKNLRHAVDRNRMKRLIREAYRVSKHKLLEEFSKAGKHLDIAVIFMGKQCVSQSDTLTAINVLLDRLLHIHEKSSQ